VVIVSLSLLSQHYVWLSILYYLQYMQIAFDAAFRVYFGNLLACSMDSLDAAVMNVEL